MAKRGTRKSAARKNEAPARGPAWVQSESTAESLQGLADEGFLPPAELGVWRAPRGEDEPRPFDGEMVLFEDFIPRGLGSPVNGFLRDLCIWWTISICNLDPNSILHISLFVAFCEMFLGIAPHFNLFRYFFVLRKKGNEGGSPVAGGCYLRLRDGLASAWLGSKHQTATKHWYKRWFYMAQDVEGRRVPCDWQQIPEPNSRWSELPSEEDMGQVRELLSLIDNKSVNGALVAGNWLAWRVQPLKGRVNYLFEYSGRDDPSRETKEKATASWLNYRMGTLFERFDPKTSYPENRVQPFCLTRPPPEVTN
jgi:hypothetical protein